MDTQFWRDIEILVIGIVIFYQVIHSIRVYVNIQSLKRIFSAKLFLRNGFIEKEKIGKIEFGSKDIHYEDKIDLDKNAMAEISGEEIIKLALIDTKGNHRVIKTIKSAINTYLINNYGAAVNFSIIKDIVDREIEVKDDEITQSITLPLYLGLAATMIGIIFGLFSMPDLDGDGFSEGVNALIGGVKIAMIGSLSGLALTTILSSFFYKNAKRIVQQDKNEQITYLQAKLLPELLKAEDTGVSGLKASLDRFARVATNISNDVLRAAYQTGENLELQRKVVEKVENLNMLKISKWNLDLFDKMENNMEAFNQFSNYLSKMERITSQLLEFANKTSDVNQVINGIDSTLKESRNLTLFLSSHLDKIQNSGDAALKSVGIAESHFEEAIRSLKERTDAIISQLFKSAGNHEESLEKIYKGIESNINRTTVEYINTFKEAYSDSIPKFKQLDNLELIKEINVTLNSLKENRELINKLDSIEEGLKKQNSNKKEKFINVNLPTPEPKVSNSNETITLGKVFKKIF